MFKKCVMNVSQEEFHLCKLCHFNFNVNNILHTVMPFIQPCCTYIVHMHYTYVSIETSLDRKKIEKFCLYYIFVAAFPTYKMWVKVYLLTFLPSLEFVYVNVFELFFVVVILFHVNIFGERGEFGFGTHCLSMQRTVMIHSAVYIYNRSGLSIYLRKM